MSTVTNSAAPMSDIEIDWTARIEANLKRADVQRMRNLFSEINPHLVGDELFESRWTEIRQDAAVLVPLIDRPEGLRILLTVRSPDMPFHAGQISFPGGRVQAEDETIIAAALRETHEEVNIPPAAVDVLGTLGVHDGGLGFSVTPVVGLIRGDVDLKPCPREVAEIFETPVEFVADLDNYVLEQREHEGVAYKMFAAPYENFHIWGLTAGILRSFAETLQDPEQRP